MTREKETIIYTSSNQIGDSVTLREKFTCGDILGMYRMHHPDIYLVWMRACAGYIYLYDPHAGWFGNSDRRTLSLAHLAAPRAEVTWVPGKVITNILRVGGYAEYCASRIAMGTDG